MVKVLLRENVEKLGRIGDVVDVRPGYARNYLLPYGVAMDVTPANVRRMEKEKARLLILEEQRKTDLTHVAARLAEASVTIVAQANEEGHLYGSVTPRQIAHALEEQGFPVEARMVVQEKPIKELGVVRDVEIHLHSEVVARITVFVVEEGRPPDAAAPVAGSLAAEGTSVVTETGKAPVTA
ncbi:MAG: 50S ribosomal protein L9 [Planctomycetes bacterium]|nr:50S ribosomal protein L9 [Planctomycetota bacterium]